MPMPRVTLTRSPDQTCPLCGKPLEVGKPAMQASNALRKGAAVSARVHPSCYAKRLKLVRSGKADTAL